jgi:hypothetical protein
MEKKIILFSTIMFVVIVFCSIFVNAETLTISAPIKKHNVPMVIKIAGSTNINSTNWDTSCSNGNCFFDIKFSVPGNSNIRHISVLTPSFNDFNAFMNGGSFIGPVNFVNSLNPCSCQLGGSCTCPDNQFSSSSKYILVNITYYQIGSLNCNLTADGDTVCPTSGGVPLFTMDVNMPNPNYQSHVSYTKLVADRVIDNGITAGQIQNYAVNTYKLADHAVKSRKLGLNQVAAATCNAGGDILRGSSIYEQVVFGGYLSASFVNSFHNNINIAQFEGEKCGDSFCEKEECITCPEDCSEYECSQRGNGICQQDLDECSNYPADCSLLDCCGNGVCDTSAAGGIEDASSCPLDCNSDMLIDPSKDGVCDSTHGENCVNSPRDCGYCLGGGSIYTPIEAKPGEGDSTFSDNIDNDNHSIFTYNPSNNFELADPSTCLKAELGMAFILNDTDDNSKHLCVCVKNGEYYNWAKTKLEIE